MHRIEHQRAPTVTSDDTAVVIGGYHNACISVRHRNYGAVGALWTAPQGHQGCVARAQIRYERSRSARPGELRECAVEAAQDAARVASALLCQARRPVYAVAAHVLPGIGDRYPRAVDGHAGSGVPLEPGADRDNAAPGTRVPAHSLMLHHDHAHY